MTDVAELSAEVRLEPEPYAAFARRIIRALGRHCETHDPWQLVHLRTVADELAATTTAAVLALHAQGYSWADIARPLGITRQAAQQTYGRKGRTNRKQADK